MEFIVSLLQAIQSNESSTMPAVCDGTENGALQTNGTEVAAESHQEAIDIDQIVCHHGRLDPQRAADMKRITKVLDTHRQALPHR